MKKYKASRRIGLKKVFGYGAVVILLLVAAYLIYHHHQAKPPAPSTDKTTSTAPSAQENFTGGGTRPIAPSPDKGSAAVSDTHGQPSAVPDKSQWTTSSTGEITVYTPAKDQIVKKGDAVAGQSNLPTVNYRVLDDISGMIAQGQLSVVNGKFSGTLSFDTKATSGRLDIYGADSLGKEFSNVEIPIRFQ